MKIKKLVRSLDDGPDMKTEIRDTDTARTLLAAKVMEEALEVAFELTRSGGINREHLAEEVGDLLDVLEAVDNYCIVGGDWVEKIRRDKEEEKGGFTPLRYVTREQWHDRDVVQIADIPPFESQSEPLNVAVTPALPEGWDEITA